MRGNDYATGYWDAEKGNVPNANRAFWTEDYIQGYADASMERDALWQSIRARRLNLQGGHNVYR